MKKKYFCQFLFTFILLSTISSFIHAQTEAIPKPKYPDTDFSSLLQLGWKYSSEKNNLSNNEFIARRLRLGVETKLSSYINSEVEIDLTDDDILKDAKVILKNSDFRLTIGKHKIPFSQERLTSVKKLFFTDRAKTISEIDELNYAGRDFGLSSEYSFSPTKKFEAKIIAGMFNGNGGRITGDNNNSKTFAERIELDYNNFKVGLNASHKNDSLTAKYISANGFDFRFKEEEWIFLGEFAYAKKENGKLPGGYFLTLNYQPDDWSASLRFENYYKNINDTVERTNIIGVALESEVFKYIKYSIELSRVDEKNIGSYFEFMILTHVSF